MRSAIYYEKQLMLSKSHPQWPSHKFKQITTMIISQHTLNMFSFLVPQQRLNV
jgi:hypothetical protein